MGAATAKRSRRPFPVLRVGGVIESDLEQRQRYAEKRDLKN